MAEPTVDDCAPSVNEISEPRFLERGQLWAVPDLLRRMRWSQETWNAWRVAGLRTLLPRTKAEHVLTDWVIDFLTASTDYDTTPPTKKA